MSETTLYLDYAGAEYVIAPAEEFQFGRHADNDLVVDDANMHLHRRLGRIVYRDGIWWLHNDGKHLVLEVYDGTSRDLLTVGPHKRAPLHFESCSIRFTAGPTTYELVVEQSGFSLGLAPRDLDETQNSEATVGAASMPLTENQFNLIVACVRPKFLDQNAPMPTTQSLAENLGWSIAKFNRQLDNVCAKFTRMGFPGLHGSGLKKAQDRKSTLAELAIRLGLVTERDLR